MALRSCDPFDIPMPADLQATLRHLESALQAQGGSFVGNESAGRFSGVTPVGTLEGKYSVEGKAIRVTITSKPMMAPCGAIESKIRGYFA